MMDDGDHISDKQVRAEADLAARSLDAPNAQSGNTATLFERVNPPAAYQQPLNDLIQRGEVPNPTVKLETGVQVDWERLFPEQGIPIARLALTEDRQVLLCPIDIIRQEPKPGEPGTFERVMYPTSITTMTDGAPVLTAGRADLAQFEGKMYWTRLDPSQSEYDTTRESLKLLETALHDVGLDSIYEAMGQKVLDIYQNSSLDLSIQETFPVPPDALSELPSELAQGRQWIDEGVWKVTEVDTNSDEFRALIGQRLLYVITEDGQMRVAPRATTNGDRVTHTMLSEGQPVLGAGTVQFYQHEGRTVIMDIDNGSGHYVPYARSIVATLDILRHTYGIEIWQEQPWSKVFKSMFWTSPEAT